ncbi:MAG: selenocysteine-specific elongation factor [Litorivivens sp.]
MIFATAGHVDHGKTSLVKALTGVDTDRLAEEKARGLTIDLGFAYFHKDQDSIGFVDVPGHSKFISNMLAGVAAIDHALLVIAADDGPMPQTAEHVAILELLGIAAAPVVISKTDRVSQEHLEQTRQSIQNFLSTTPYTMASVYEVSSIEGTGIAELQAHLWTLKSERVQTHEEYFRLAIDRRFSVKGSGLVVTGSVFSGTVKLNDELRLMPSNLKVRVRAIHRQDTSADFAGPGDRCALNLSGDVDTERVERGQWVTSHPALPVSRRLDGQIRLLASEQVPLKTGLPVHIHLGAQHTTGRVFLLEQRQIEPGESALAQIVCESPLSACYGDRFVIRDQSASRTLAGGWTVDPYSVQKGRSKPIRLMTLKQLALRTPDGQLPVLDDLIRVAVDGINLEHLSNALNQKLFVSKHPIDDSGLSHHQDQVKATQQAALIQIEKVSQTQSQLRQALGIRESFLKLILNQLLTAGEISVQGNQISPAGKQAELSKPAAALWQKVEPILQREGLQPPVIHDLAKQVNLPPAALEKLLDGCVKQGLLVRPVKNRFFLTQSLDQIRQLAIDVANSEGGEFTVIQFRDKSGMGRNLCIELLEFLDGKGFTKRLGDKRVIQDIHR